ncbi:hypothetical protein AAHH80_31935, partial [Burkholderia pseudomallei]
LRGARGGGAWCLPPRRTTPRTVNFIIHRACKTVVLNPINWMRNIPYVIVIANVIGHDYNRSKAGIRYK